MSVILYDNDKFKQIAATMKLKGKDLMFIWNYPTNWEKPEVQAEHIEDFVNQMRLNNQKAYNERYEEEDYELKEVEFSAADAPYNSTYELIKSLNGVHYNSIESPDYNDSIYIMFLKVINFYMFSIISEMKEYESAQTW